MIDGTLDTVGRLNQIDQMQVFGYLRCIIPLYASPIRREFVVGHWRATDDAHRLTCANRGAGEHAAARMPDGRISTRGSYRVVSRQRCLAMAYPLSSIAPPCIVPRRCVWGQS